MFLIVPLFVWTLCPLSFAYQAPEEKKDIFGTRPCPAFLIFETAAYLSDMTIELPCHCKPVDVLSVVWYYQKHLGTNTRVLTDFSGNAVVDTSKVGRSADLRGRFSIRLFSLVAFRVQPSDSGHYICGTESGEFFYGYDVDVQVVRLVLFPLNVSQEATERRPVSKKPFEVFVSHWPWSTCDRCNTEGERVQIGLCYVMSRYLQVRYLKEDISVASCGSSSVPLRFGLNSEAYGAQLVVQSCLSFCPPRPVPHRTSLQDFLGYGDPAAAGLAVYYHNHPTETDLVLSCPRAGAEQVVAWDKGAKPLYRSQYMEGLNEIGRVFIDAGHHLHFRPVTLEDKGTYYCWVQGSKVAEIRLGVHSRPGRRRQISDSESLFALGVMISFFSLITALFLLMNCIRCVWMYRIECKAKQ